MSQISSFIYKPGGIITREDLLRYEAVKSDPLVIKLKDESTVYSPPPPSSGAVFEFILNILDGMWCYAFLQTCQLGKYSGL